MKCGARSIRSTISNYNTFPPSNASDSILLPEIWWSKLNVLWACIFQLIRDPFNEKYFVAQATHPEVSKGQALSDLKEFLSYSGRTIAAGDDYNDLSMLAKADIKGGHANSP